MVPLTAPLFGVIFLRGHISLKNRTYCPILRESTSQFTGNNFLALAAQLFMLLSLFPHMNMYEATLNLLLFEASCLLLFEPVTVDAYLLPPYLPAIVFIMYIPL
jgi:hypothetical protein